MLRQAASSEAESWEHQPAEPLENQSLNRSAINDRQLHSQQPGPLLPASSESYVGSIASPFPCTHRSSGAQQHGPEARGSLEPMALMAPDMMAHFKNCTEVEFLATFTHKTQTMGEGSQHNTPSLAQGECLGRTRCYRPEHPVRREGGTCEDSCRHTRRQVCVPGSQTPRLPR